MSTETDKELAERMLKEYADRGAHLSVIKLAHRLLARERDDLVEACRVFARLSSSVPAGWKLVPLEPTKAMIDAGYSADPLACDVEYAEDVYPPIYIRMVDEAPSPVELEVTEALMNKPGDPETWFEQAWVLAAKDNGIRCRSKEDAKFWFLGGAAMRSRAGGVPDGWRLVPIKPTDAMIHYGLRVSGCFNQIDEEVMLLEYAAMLSAAPSPGGTKDE